MNPINQSYTSLIPNAEAQRDKEKAINKLTEKVKQQCQKAILLCTAASNKCKQIDLDFNLVRLFLGKWGCELQLSKLIIEDAQEAIVKSLEISKRILEIDVSANFKELSQEISTSSVAIISARSLLECCETQVQSSRQQPWWKEKEEYHSLGFEIGVKVANSLHEVQKGVSTAAELLEEVRRTKETIANYCSSTKILVTQGTLQEADQRLCETRKVRAEALENVFEVIKCIATDKINFAEVPLPKDNRLEDIDAELQKEKSKIPKLIAEVIKLGNEIVAITNEAENAVKQAKEAANKTLMEWQEGYSKAKASFHYALELTQSGGRIIASWQGPDKLKKKTTVEKLDKGLLKVSRQIGNPTPILMDANENDLL